jgi:hypothetical protein
VYALSFRGYSSRGDLPIDPSFVDKTTIIGEYLMTVDSELVT